jgi:hypothetical protein
MREFYMSERCCRDNSDCMVERRIKGGGEGIGDTYESLFMNVY